MIFMLSIACILALSKASCRDDCTLVCGRRMSSGRVEFSSSLTCQDDTLMLSYHGDSACRWTAKDSFPILDTYGTGCSCDQVAFMQSQVFGNAECTGTVLEENTNLVFPVEYCNTYPEGSCKHLIYSQYMKVTTWHGCPQTETQTQTQTDGDIEMKKAFLDFYYSHTTLAMARTENGAQQIMTIVVIAVAIVLASGVLCIHYCKNKKEREYKSLA